MLQEEFASTMALMGVRTVADINPQMLDGRSLGSTMGQPPVDAAFQSVYVPLCSKM